jgi:hypothetical protein
MPVLTVLGVTPETLTLRGKKNAFMLTMTASGDISAKLAEIMGWESLLYDDGTLRENWDSIELESSVGSGEMVLTPNGRDGKSRALTINISGAENFKAVRKGGDNGDQTRLTLRSRPRSRTARPSWAPSGGRIRTSFAGCGSLTPSRPKLFEPPTDEEGQSADEDTGDRGGVS